MEIKKIPSQKFFIWMYYELAQYKNKYSYQREKIFCGAAAGHLINILILNLLLLFISHTSDIHAATNVGGRISANTVWTKANSPYIVTSIIQIYGDTDPVTLTIEPGVEIRFGYSAGLQVGSGSSRGILQAIGNETEKIKFTSNTTTSPTKGSWRNIFIDDGGDGTTIQNCIIEYGAQGGSANENIYIYNSSPSINQCIIRESRAEGIRITGDSSPNIVGNQIINNDGYGIYCNDIYSNPFIGNNNFNENGSYAIRIRISKIKNVDNNNISGNIRSGIELIGERITENITLKEVYKRYDIVEGNIQIYGDNVPKLTIEPGVEIRFGNNAGLQVGSGSSGGILQAIGTDTNKIKFTSNTTSPVKGSWRNIFIDDGSMDYDDITYEGTILENCIIEYGSYYADENIYISNSSPKISKCEIKESRTNGIKISGSSSPLITGNTISNNGTYGIFNNDSTVKPQIKGNDFISNGSYPIRIFINSMNGLDRDNTYSENDMIEVIGEVINNGEIIFKDIDIPYFINGNINVQNQNPDIIVRLKFEPGIELRFNRDVGLYCGSYPGSSTELIAIGTKDKPIKFTSINGGNSNPGDWAGIIFSGSNADTKSEMEWCQIEYGGGSGYPRYSGNISLYFYNSKLELRNCTIKKSKQYGIYYGFYQRNSSITINSSKIIENNNSGVYADAPNFEMRDCIIESNGDYGLRIRVNSIGKLIDNSINSNNKEGIYVFGGIITDTAVWKKENSPYIIGGDINIFGTNNPILSIESGVELKFEAYAGLSVNNGALSAIGTPEQIKFTSNNIGSDWDGISFYGGTIDANTILDNCLIEYGGISNANLYFFDASPNIKNCIIKNSSTNGIYCTNSSPLIEKNTIDGSGSNGVYCENNSNPKIISSNTIINSGGSGIYCINNSSPIIDGNNINSNNGYGIYCYDIWNSPLITNNIITNNKNYAIKIGADKLRQISNNTIDSNIKTGLEIIGERITQDTILEERYKRFDVVWASISVYGNLNNSVTLTIEAGVEVRFSGGIGIRVGTGNNKGILRAIGTSANKIIFTANTNNPQKGYWNNIYFDNSTGDYNSITQEGTILENCKIEFGAENIYITNCSPMFDSCEIINSRSNGITIDGNSSPIITNNKINNNNAYGISSFGINNQPQIKNNAITDNGSYPIGMSIYNVNKLEKDNTYGNNNPDRVEILGNSLVFAINSGEITFKEINIPYYINGDIYFSSRSNDKVKLIVESGVELRFKKDTGLYFYGYSTYPSELKAIGTKDKPIKFTSNEENPNSGDWKGIIFSGGNANTISEMDWCTVEYGGKNNPGNIYLFYGVKLKIENSIIQKSYQHGIYNNNSVLIIDNSKITGNNGYGIFNETSADDAQITANDITGNGEYGLRIGANSIWKLKNNNISSNAKDGIYVVGGTVADTAVWEKRNNPYIIGGDINISGTTIPMLNIESGVELKFEANAGLSVTNGALSAIGAAEQIKFTSNNIGSNWDGISFYGGTVDENTILDNCLIEYGGISNANLYFSDASPVIKNSVIKYSSMHGIYCINASPTIENNKIEQNKGYGMYCRDAGSNPVITGNAISNNINYGIRIGANKINQLYNNVYSNNGKSGFEILGERITQNIILKKEYIRYDVVNPNYDRNINYDYIIPYAPISVYGDTTVTLGIEPGVEVRFDSYTGLQIGSSNKKGILQAIGKNTEKIIFTAMTDETPIKGAWANIHIDDGAVDYDSASAQGTILENCKIEYGAGVYAREVANSAFYNRYKDENIYINNSSPKISKCEIKESRTNGIKVDGENSKPLIIENVIKSNENYGIYLSSSFPRVFNSAITSNTQGGIYSINSAPLINYSYIYNNSGYGIYNISPILINAKYNWWGDITGPLDDNDNRGKGGEWYNPRGKGDKVTDYINYSEWRSPLIRDRDAMTWQRE